ncbi:MAG TPA: hypothetical protein VH143_03175 [Kofleriaceae bacterium]|jgi:hypothetical protein|nr:hypothetical protein [Kofleriaceae bacterium]
MRIALCVLGALAACTDVVNSPGTDPSTKLDEAVFRCNVQPILARQCSYLACHGQAGTALRVYTPGKLRATPAQSLDDLIAPLTDDEQHGNFTSAAGFAVTAPSADDNWLLKKPLPASAGGFEHAGGAIYTGTSDSQYQAIRAWLAGSGACAN